MRFLKPSLTVLTLAWASGASADVVDTFQAFCFANLGSAKAIEQSAVEAGFVPSPLGPVLGGFLGDREATDETVQVNIQTKHEFECAVTTSDVDDPGALEAKFLASVGLTANNPKRSIEVEGQTYFFLFDTNGGEALVVYR